MHLIYFDVAKLATGDLDKGEEIKKWKFIQELAQMQANEICEQQKKEQNAAKGVTKARKR